MKKISILLILAFLTIFLLPPFGFSERAIQVKTKKLALVIGNGAYKNFPLKNPANDAYDMATTLRKVGFEVTHCENASQKAMEGAIREFGRRLRAGGIGLFYFAGHGIQVNGRNYLIPTGTEIANKVDVKYEAVDAGRVLDEMYQAENGLNIVILDACRNNPFARSFGTGSRGLARMPAPTGTFIAYATAPDSIAMDGADRNGVFTKFLLRNIVISGLKIEDVLKRVRIEVMRETNNKQVPWQTSSLTGDFYFVPRREPTITERPGVEQPGVEQEKKELLPLKPDRSDAKSTAKAILKAYRTRDVIALSGLSRKFNRKLLAELAAQGESHPRYNSIFSGWRWQLIKKWNGQIGDVRYQKNKGRLGASVVFSEMNEHEVAVVTVIWEEGQWCFEDIHSPSIQRFESASQTINSFSDVHKDKAQKPSRLKKVRVKVREGRWEEHFTGKKWIPAKYEDKWVAGE